MYRSFVNSSYTHLGTVGQTGHILEIGSNSEGAAEKKPLVANQENAGSQDEKACNDKDP